MCIKIPSRQILCYKQTVYDSYLRPPTLTVASNFQVILITDILRLTNIKILLQNDPSLNNKRRITVLRRKLKNIFYRESSRIVFFFNCGIEKQYLNISYCSCIIFCFHHTQFYFIFFYSWHCYKTYLIPKTIY